MTFRENDEWMMRYHDTVPRHIAGLHILVSVDEDTNRHRRNRRRVLQAGIDKLITGWNWQSSPSGRGRRICCMQDGAPAPPVSISYSGPVALLLVSADWRSVGIDIEVTSPHRRGRYAEIAQTFARQRPVDAMATFVRAEAWAKAADCGFNFGAAYFLGESLHAGFRHDGRVVRDIELRNLLPEFITSTTACAAALCADAQAVTPVIHPPLCVS